jgi:RNA polymerase sigma-70 factor, ECF subfamily
MWLFWAVVNRANTPPGDRSMDQEVLQRMTRGEPDALAELYDRHARSIYSLAVRIVRDQADAEDIVQEVFSQAWRQANRYDAARGNVAAWLLTLARSRAIDWLRGRRSRPWDSSEGSAPLTLADSGLGPDVLAASAEQMARVRNALQSIPLVERVALELAYFDGHTHTEIATRLELPLGTVKTRIRQGLLRLRAAMTGEA